MVTARAVKLGRATGVVRRYNATFQVEALFEQKDGGLKLGDKLE